ncbi:MAG: hypothetical protein IPH59_11705 [bacterium]|nr:hypothetical protein [bacterium]
MVDKPVIPQDKLEYIAEEAYVTSRSIEEWCAKIFALLALREEYLPGIPRHQLLAAAVKISGTHLEIDAMPPSSLPGPGATLAVVGAVETARGGCRIHLRRGHQSLRQAGEDLPRDGSLLWKRRRALSGRQVQWKSGRLVARVFSRIDAESEHKHYLKRYKYVLKQS